ncbi:hypothetical protein AGMMS49975_08100 [Clostridia bacterium]|nr:hypothetical protein AGMMS49975_08100 [Clostridia bacterium]
MSDKIQEESLSKSLEELSTELIAELAKYESTRDITRISNIRNKLNWLENNKTKIPGVANNINELAKKLVEFAPTDSACILAAQEMIMLLEFETITIIEKEEYVDDVCYVPLIESELMFNIWLKTVVYLTGYNEKEQKWNYDPTKGTFTTALRYLLNKRKGEGFEKSKDISLEERIEKIGDKGELVDTGADVGEFQVIDGFAFIAPIISEYKNFERGFKKSKRSFFEGFYTFYLAESIRITKCVSENEAIRKDRANDGILYRATDEAMTDYLIFDSPRSMREIAFNALKSEECFDKRYETIGECYDITRQTVANRYEKYKDLKKFILYGIFTCAYFSYD